MSETHPSPPHGAPDFHGPPPVPAGSSWSAPPTTWSAPPAAAYQGRPPAGSGDERAHPEPDRPSASWPTPAWNAATSTGPTATAVPQRPAVVAMGATLAVAGSLQWVCGLAFLWVTAAVGASAFDQVGESGPLFHILNRMNFRLLDGLAVPLFGFPVAALVTGFLVLHRRPWTRLAHTLVGAAALAWSAWWLRESLLWWFSAAWYVVVAVLVLWAPAATAWYRWSEPRPGR